MWGVTTIRKVWFEKMIGWPEVRIGVFDDLAALAAHVATQLESP
jgi:hypothetical protein